MNPINILPKIIISLMIGCFFIGKAQVKPSFDCLKASTATEIAICSDENLAVLDTEMANLYGQLNKSIPEPHKEILLEEQIAWLAERDSCEDNIACLKIVIQGRITHLQAELERITLPPNEGAMLISTGFLPDPLTITGSVKGHTDVTQWAYEGCSGFIESSPIITLHLDINVPYLRIYLESEASTTLIALHQTNFGIFPLCSKNLSSESGNAHPMLELTKSGNYEVFVAIFEKAEDEATNYTLYISELQP